jgi:hypothetical protein
MFSIDFLQALILLISCALESAPFYHHSPALPALARVGARAGTATFAVNP